MIEKNRTYFKVNSSHKALLTEPIKPYVYIYSSVVKITLRNTEYACLMQSCIYILKNSKYVYYFKLYNFVLSRGLGTDCSWPSLAYSYIYIYIYIYIYEYAKEGHEQSVLRVYNTYYMHALYLRIDCS